MKDEISTRRPAPSPYELRPEQPGWEQRQQPDQGWERRNERHDRLREGRDHPLHHGRPLHGGHAFDGGDRDDNELPLRTYPPVR